MDATHPDATTTPIPDGNGEAPPGLLLGLIAAQVGLVGREALLGAVRDWAADRSRDLGDLLLARGAIDARRLGLLRELARATLEQQGGDPDRAAAAFDPPGPTLRAVRRIVDDTAADGPPGDGPASTVDSPPSGSTVDAPAGEGPSRRGRYRVVRFHAKGGLGRVSVAIDEELDRAVALKEIREDFADDRESRAAFVYEAEVTGRLDHPGVVPVFGLGRDESGRPYYAMRFIRGETLAAAIAAFHAPGAAGGGRALELRRLLRRFIDVCNAIEYAHDRGVIHRDLKPKNIMLGPHGETLVVDWGLAKPIGRRDGSTEVEGTIRPSSGDDYATRYGSIKGTPAYMSPEQAEGRVDELTAASDVYALGAILYEILTGARAFPGKDQDEVLDRVRAGDFPRPREANRSALRPLEAVCLKAMALDPGDRYATALALAEDIERWLADEPVLARREPLPARAARWARRHRTAAVAAGVLLVVMSAGLAVDDVRVSREKAETAKALVEKAEAFDLAKKEGARAESQRALAEEARGKAEAEEQRAVAARGRATKHLDHATQALDEIWEVVAGPALTASAAEDRLRLKLALIALNFNEKSLELSPGDGRIKLRVARRSRVAANLGSQAGQFDEPLKQYGRSIALFEELAARATRDPAYPLGLASTLKDLGDFYRMNGKLREADASLRRALDAIGRAAVKTGDEPFKRRELGVVQTNLAVVLIARGDYPGARHAADEAVAALDPLARSDEGDRMWLVMALTARGQAAREAKDLRAAEEALDRADREARGLLAKEADRRDYRYLLASTAAERGRLLALDPARRAAAFAAFDEAVRLVDPLAKTFPHVSFYTRDLAGALDGRGAALLDDGQVAPAARDCRAARELLEGLLRARDLPADRGELGRTLGDLGRVARAEGKPEEAATLLDRAVAEQRAALAGNPESLIDRELLDRHKADLAGLNRVPDRR